LDTLNTELTVIYHNNLMKQHVELFFCGKLWSIHISLTKTCTQWPHTRSDEL